MKILDLSAGNRGIWYDKKNPLCTFIDKRPEVNPDIVANTCDLNMIEDGSYDLVLFDPPHVNCGKNSNMSRVYGYHTTKEILETIEGTAKEAHRVSRSGALLALKWNDHDIKLQRVFDLMPQWEPLFGALTKNGPGSKTYWAMMRRI
jgi:hypothetical protein